MRGAGGQAADFGKRDDVGQEADAQDPEVAFGDREPKTPAEDKSNNQISDDRAEKFHGVEDNDLPAGFKLSPKRFYANYANWREFEIGGYVT